MLPNFPTVSFIIPTYNVEKYIKRCLDSIFVQDFPKEKFEVIVADGGSSDRTLSILGDYNIVLIHNPARDCDDGKFLALNQAKGEFVALVDSDNIIAASDWLRQMVQPLMEDPSLIGVESNYLIAEDFSSINVYANLLVIVDPLARMLANHPSQVELRNGYMVKRYKRGTVPVAGANGFIWRKSVIDAFNDKSAGKFAEANLLSKIAYVQEIAYANIPNQGIYHYYCITFLDYMRKRRKIARKFLGRKSRYEQTWVDQRQTTFFLLCTLYLGTIVGPTIEAVANVWKSRKKEWLWHPVVSFFTVAIYMYSFLRSVVQSNAKI